MLVSGPDPQFGNAQLQLKDWLEFQNSAVKQKQKSEKRKKICFVFDNDEQEATNSKRKQMWGI